MGVASETFVRIAPPLREGQTRVTVDTGNVTPGPLEAHKNETVVPLVDRQNHPVNPPTKQPHAHPLSRRALSQQEEPVSVGGSPLLQASAAVSQGQPNGGQTLRGQSATRKGLAALPRPCGSAWGEKPPEPAVSGLVKRPQTADEPNPPAVAQEPSQESESVQGHNFKCHPTTVAEEEVGAIRKEGYMQDSFLGISWEGWGLIKTPDGVYLPETFSPFPHVFEDLTDQWDLSKGGGET